MTVQSTKTDKVQVITVQDDKGKRKIVLKKSHYSIGRSSQCDVRIYSPFVSRHHATIKRRIDNQDHIYYEIVDGDGRKPSANGIIVNGKKVANRNLQSGDRIVFGPEIYIKYQQCEQDIFPINSPDDPFDITLIDPALIGDDLDD